MRKKRKILKHHAESAAMRGYPGQVPTVKFDSARVGFFQPRNDTQQGGFPATGRPQKAKKISGLKAQIYALKSENAVEISIDINNI
jgi:hypothetical protein